MTSLRDHHFREATLKRLWGSLRDHHFLRPDVTVPGPPPPTVLVGRSQPRHRLRQAAEQCPGKKPWLMQKDGDLWQQYWKAALLKNPRAIRHGKVKGHATEEMVKEGRVREREKVGHGEADAMAAEGEETFARGELRCRMAAAIVRGVLFSRLPAAVV